MGFTTDWLCGVWGRIGEKLGDIEDGNKPGDVRVIVCPCIRSGPGVEPDTLIGVGRGGELNGGKGRGRGKVEASCWGDGGGPGYWPWPRPVGPPGRGCGGRAKLLFPDGRASLIIPPNEGIPLEKPCPGPPAKLGPCAAIEPIGPTDGGTGLIEGNTGLIG